MNWSDATNLRSGEPLSKGRLFGCFSFFCWAACLTALGFTLRESSIVGVMLAALAALGGVTFTTLTARRAFLSRNRVAFLTLALSMVFAIVACWMAIFVWQMLHYPS